MGNTIKIAFMAILTLLTIMVPQIQPVSAWSATNHYLIVEEVFYFLPNDVQDKLSLSEMLNGADDPDYKFFDFEFHQYPATEQKAQYWLDRGRKYYFNGDYKQASYCFGVASHYLSDGVCAPHTRGGQSSYQHTKYELEALLLTPHISVNRGNKDEMLTDSSGMENVWDQWLKTGDDKLIQRCLDQAATVSYQKIKSAVS